LPGRPLEISRKAIKMSKGAAMRRKKKKKPSGDPQKKAHPERRPNRRNRESITQGERKGKSSTKPICDPGGEREKWNQLFEDRERKCP